jgi:acetyl esterase/lipase
MAQTRLDAARSSQPVLNQARGARLPVETRGAGAGAAPAVILWSLTDEDGWPAGWRHRQEPVEVLAASRLVGRDVRRRALDTGRPLVCGRGGKSRKWAERVAQAWLASRPQCLRYGDGVRQYGWARPAAQPSAAGGVVLLHGGFWSEAFGPETMEPLAAALSRAGLATVNLEYASSADGAWPAQRDDLALAWPHILHWFSTLGVAPGRIILAGHSVGAHLALQACLTGACRPKTVFALAPLLDPASPDLSAGARAAVRRLLGPGEADAAGITPDLAAAPMAPVWIATGDEDADVQPPAGADIERWRSAGARIERSSFAHMDHMDLIKPDTAAGAEIIQRALAAAGSRA